MQTNALWLNSSDLSRCLLACQFDQTTAVAQLSSAIAAMTQAWPAELNLLTTEAEGWLFCDTSFYPKIKIARLEAKRLIAAMAGLNFDAVLVFTQPGVSPYSLAYFSYLAAIPIRVGQSSEFGGSLLSHPVQPPLDRVEPAEYHWHLLQIVQPSIFRNPCG